MRVTSDLEIQMAMDAVLAFLKGAQARNAAISMEIEQGVTRTDGGQGYEVAHANGTQTLTLTVNGGAKDEDLVAAVTTGAVVVP